LRVALAVSASSWVILIIIGGGAPGGGLGILKSCLDFLLVVAPIGTASLAAASKSLFKNNEDIALF
jgi:hypothetical protein